ncbi:hypothetical protein [Hyphococcus sp.]|uniref:hypothetical protein n=1 Tax=Hyphococcus sp. TaxID=2038636 RepID=UPI002082BC93|nr:MAG: hypothetical protein DHS20C04_30590 [Marinicaulis sp.]
MSYISKIEPERKRLADRVLTDWAFFSEIGDFARAIFAPTFTSRAIYGSPITAGCLFFLERLLLGADVVVVQSFKRKIVVLPEESFVAIMEARND